MSEGTPRGLPSRPAEQTDHTIGQTDIGSVNDRNGHRSGPPAKPDNNMQYRKGRWSMQNPGMTGTHVETTLMTTDILPSLEHLNVEKPSFYDQLVRDYKSYISSKYNKIYLITGTSMIMLMSLFLYAVMSHNIGFIFVFGLPMIVFCIFLAFLLERAKQDESET